VPGLTCEEVFWLRVPLPDGLPLLVSPAVPVTTVYGLPASRVAVVVRKDGEVTSDRSVFFTSDRVAVRGTMRVAFGFPHPAAIIKVGLAA
jgi:hypothetical protein